MAERPVPTDQSSGSSPFPAVSVGTRSAQQKEKPQTFRCQKGQMGTLDFSLQVVMVRQCPSSPCKSGVKITHSNPVKQKTQGFPGRLEVGDLPANVGDTNSTPGAGRPHMPQSN